MVVYSKVAFYTCKPLVYTCKPLLYKKNLKERCYLHSVQQSYEKKSCKPGIKYFTSVNCCFTVIHHFTLVNYCFTVICRFTLVNHRFTVICWFTLVNHHFTVIRQFTKDHLLRRQQLFLVSSSAVCQGCSFVIGCLPLVS